MSEKEESKVAAEAEKKKEAERRRVAHLEAKLGLAETPLQKADCQRQLAIIQCGGNALAVAKVNADYMAYKTDLFAAAAKAKAVAKAKAAAGAA